MLLQMFPARYTQGFWGRSSSQKFSSIGKELKPKQIKGVSVSAQGDIFGSAIRLGSVEESAKGLARDDRSAIWDFEERGNMSQDLKSIFCF